MRRIADAVAILKATDYSNHKVDFLVAGVFSANAFSHLLQEVCLFQCLQVVEIEEQHETLDPQWSEIEHACQNFLWRNVFSKQMLDHADVAVDNIPGGCVMNLDDVDQ
jgi:hypothetical protein